MIKYGIEGVDDVENQDQPSHIQGIETIVHKCFRCCRIHDSPDWCESSQQLKKLLELTKAALAVV